MEVNEVGKSVQKKFTSFLSDKPMWVFWITYSILSGILFGIFYAAMYLMAQLWWVPVIVIIVIGMIWGTLAYPKEAQKLKEKK
ncbi:MAG: hypothetical protein KKI09_06475 [Spirochaetes bacterium]|nr:hypothetical protein [Spirochaetota bacterium]